MSALTPAGARHSGADARDHGRVGVDAEQHAPAAPQHFGALVAGHPPASTPDK
ncbi:hypothetical protein [Massilia sp. TWR1-2-2]|uniref:hypothetical protein n=1 Tax=Massilia sp. TWR1-2-2 TaxID=2804584 RepID=UPI003CEB15BF